jgi:hypothetical protein
MQYQNIFSGKLKQHHRTHARGTRFCLAPTVKNPWLTCQKCVYKRNYSHVSHILCNYSHVSHIDLDSV